MNARECALRYAAGGCSVIPIRADGSKAAALKTWKEFQDRIASADEINVWYDQNPHAGVGIVCGQVSSYLNVLDIEYADFLVDLIQLVEALDSTIIGNLPQVATPGKANTAGRHLYFRTLGPISTGKLATLTTDDAKSRTGDPNKRTAIEVRGTGSYVLAPGCPPTCHPSGKQYVHTGGPMPEDAPVLTYEQVEILISCARALTREDPVRVQSTNGKTSTQLASSKPTDERPGDAFNRKASWQEILSPHGWQLVYVKQGVEHYRRPGKDHGISATAGYCKSVEGYPLLCVFSTNAGELAPDNGKDHHTLSKFEAYARLQCGGDRKKAALALGSIGYGIDLGMREIEQIARGVVKHSEILDQSAMADIRSQVLEVCAKRGLAVANSEEIDQLVNNVIFHEQWTRWAEDPAKLVEAMAREVYGVPVNGVPTNGDGSVPTTHHPTGGVERVWKLVIVESDPVKFKLRAPYWLTAMPGGFIELTSEELASWNGPSRCIEMAALRQAQVCVPKFSAWRGDKQPLAHLLSTAERMPVPLEFKRPMVVLEYCYSKLRSAAPAQIDSGGKIELTAGAPMLFPDARIVFKPGFLVQQAKYESPDITRAELTAALSASGCSQWVGPDNTRWWVATPGVMTAMEAKLRG